MKLLLLILMGIGLLEGTPPPVKLLCIVLSVAIIMVIGIKENT
jgi:hypothetical protein